MSSMVSKVGRLMFSSSPRRIDRDWLPGRAGGSVDRPEDAGAAPADADPLATRDLAGASTLATMVWGLSMSVKTMLPQLPDAAKNSPRFSGRAAHCVAQM
jgi:hypothetical protein